jgi:hydrogenase maturation protein HypF
VSERVRTAIRVEGIVQGVGFRPFVYSLATSLGLGGLVGNDADGVFAEGEGPPAAVHRLLARLEQDAPPLARIERVRTWDLQATAKRTTSRTLGGSAGEIVETLARRAVSAAAQQRSRAT